MEKKIYQNIDGDILNFTGEDIKSIFGANGLTASFATYFGTKTFKFAFYNTGELCEVSFVANSPIMCVRCHGNRKEDILGWLKKYLENGMESRGWKTDIREDKDEYFYASFYQKNME